MAGNKRHSKDIKKALPEARLSVEQSKIADSFFVKESNGAKQSVAYQ